MGLKSKLSVLYARYVVARQKKWMDSPLETSRKDFKKLIEKGKKTTFGKDHDFGAIKSYEDFKKRVPIRDYEGLKPYIERVIEGERDVLWPGQPIYLCKTSGTTSGTKYIPLTKDSMPNHINSAKNALLHYIVDSGNSDFVDGKMIFLQGSPVLNNKGKIPTGRLSGIVANYVPGYLQKNRMPSYTTNCIEDWETKVDKIVEETQKEDMRLISGIPSWVQMYFEKLLTSTGKKAVKDIFPNFSLFVYGGVNYEPYREHFEELMGKKVDSIELYPASEGFIAYQDKQNEKGLLLVLNSGIFYEFIVADTFNNEDATRISLDEVQLNVNYVLIINNNAGLWGYNIGDTVMFVSLAPYRIIVSGRIKHFISSFGEHVIGKEVEAAMSKAVEEHGGKVAEFTVAPQVRPIDGLPYHEWFIEFAKEPDDMDSFKHALDLELQKQNTYYYDLIQGKVLQELIISRIAKDGFNSYMKSIGKLGGQNKIPRLSNDRKIADEIIKWKV
jgi:acyl-CoA synthetase (AMP-forming)/AMP-acid ligase II